MATIASRNTSVEEMRKPALFTALPIVGRRCLYTVA